MGPSWWLGVTHGDQFGDLSQLPVVPIHRKRWLGELSPGSFQESLETKNKYLQSQIDVLKCFPAI